MSPTATSSPMPRSLARTIHPVQCVGPATLWRTRWVSASPHGCVASNGCGCNPRSQRVRRYSCRSKGAIVRSSMALRVGCHCALFASCGFHFSKRRPCTRSRALAFARPTPGHRPAPFSGALIQSPIRSTPVSALGLEPSWRDRCVLQHGIQHAWHSTAKACPASHLRPDS